MSKGFGSSLIRDLIIVKGWRLQRTDDGEDIHHEHGLKAGRRVLSACIHSNNNNT